MPEVVAARYHVDATGRPACADHPLPHRSSAMRDSRGEGSSQMPTRESAERGSSGATRFSTERKVNAGFAVAIACLALVTVASFLSVSQLNENARSVAHTQEVLGQLEKLLAALT